MTTLQFAAVLNTMLESASRTVYAAAVTIIGGLNAIGPLTPNLVLDETLPRDTFPVGLIFNPTSPNPLERTTYPLALPPIGLPVPLYPPRITLLFPVIVKPDRYPIATLFDPLALASND